MECSSSEDDLAGIAWDASGGHARHDEDGESRRLDLVSSGSEVRRVRGEHVVDEVVDEVVGRAWVVGGHVAGGGE